MEKEKIIVRTQEVLSTFETEQIVRFLKELTIKTIFENPLILGLLFIVFFYAIIKRSKFVLLFLFFGSGRAFDDDLVLTLLAANDDAVRPHLFVVDHVLRMATVADKFHGGRRYLSNTAVSLPVRLDRPQDIRRNFRL